MKIERISDNQIRCTLTSGDLSSRNINLIELAYGTEKARRLFREMIQTAASEFGFDAENIPLMVEAIPLSGESIMLVITKVEDPEELDTRFAKFSPLTEENEPPLSQLTGEFLEGASESLPFLESVGQTQEPAGEEGSDARDRRSALRKFRIFRFDQLDRIAEAAGALTGIYDGSNLLYKKPGTHQYYLVIRREGADDLAFSRACNILAEYASRLPGEYASEAYFSEHYEVLIGERALQKLAVL